MTSVYIPSAFRFLRHFLEMLLAMVLGMALVGALFRGDTAAAAGTLAMAGGMTAPVVLWMRHRGHGTRAVAEMSAAMIVPALALVSVHAANVIAAAALPHVQHGLMVPSMLAVMLLRRGEYTRPLGR